MSVKKTAGAEKAVREASGRLRGEKVPPKPMELELKSAALLDSAEKAGEELGSLYTTIAGAEDCEVLELDVKQKIQSLDAANDNIREVYRRTRNMRDELSARWDDFKHSKRKKKLISPAPSNASIDLIESETKHFTQGLNIYKLLWICYIGSFVGVVIELLWCLLTNGYLESRAGLVWGPFNLLYGIGAMAISIALYQYRNYGKLKAFIGGFIAGSVVEYVCSWAQELMFGSRSWDYSDKPFNLNGRICLLYSVFWGLLGILWIKSLYPRMAELILKIPNKIGKPLTWIIFAFFVIDAVVSVIACFRWAQRLGGVEAANWFWSFIDSRFPNERMQRIYANMVF